MNSSFSLARALASVLLLLALAAPARADLTQALGLLTSKNINDRAQAVELLGEDDSPAATDVLQALQDGVLFVHAPTHSVVRAVPRGDVYTTTDFLTGASQTGVAKDELSRVATSNAIRGKLQALQAVRDLASSDVNRRRQAVSELPGRIASVTLASLDKKLATETDAAVRHGLEIAIAMKRLLSDAPEDAAAALSTLNGNLDPAVLTALSTAREQTQNPAVKKALDSAMDSIKTRASLFGFAETLFFGASLGSVLILSAIGLAITFGVMGVINMAHGELMMIGAYTTYVIQQIMPEHIDLSLFVAIPAAFLIAALVGIVIERGIIRFLYGRPLETLLATFGISLVLQQAVRTIFSPLNRSVSTPSWMSGSWRFNPIFSLTWNRLAIIVFCLLVFTALFTILRRTRLGLEVRAVSQNRAMARAMGTRAAMVDAMTFGLGSGIAGIAGVALSQLTNVGPNLGQAYIIDSFMVVVFGGVGNLWGTLVAGLGLGVINKVLEPVSGAVLAKILVLVFIILFIQKRPTGLFPQKGRAIED